MRSFKASFAFSLPESKLNLIVFVRVSPWRNFFGALSCLGPFLLPELDFLYFDAKRLVFDDLVSASNAPERENVLVVLNCEPKFLAAGSALRNMSIRNPETDKCEG